MHSSFFAAQRSQANARSSQAAIADRPTMIKNTKAELETAKGDAGTAKQRLDNAWKDLNATRRSAGISQAEYQLKQTAPGVDADRLRGKIADKEKTYAPVINNHYDKIRAAEADVEKSESKVRTLDAKVLRLESGGPLVDRNSVTESSTPLAPHASLMRSTGQGAPQSSALGHAPAQNSGVFLEDLVPTVGIPFQLPSPLDRPGSHAEPTRAQKLHIKPDHAE